MEELDRKIARLAEELKRLEEEMRRSGIAVTPELARARRWELGRRLASFYQRWHDFMLLHLAHPAPAYRHLDRAQAHAPRPD